MITIMLTEAEHKNLLLFLQRVTLNAMEISAFIDVTNKLQNSNNKENINKTIES